MMINARKRNKSARVGQIILVHWKGDVLAETSRKWEDAVRLSGGGGSQAEATACAKAPGCEWTWHIGAMAKKPNHLEKGQKDESWKMKPERTWGRRPSVGSLTTCTGKRFPPCLAESAGGFRRYGHLTTSILPSRERGVISPRASVSFKFFH